jgi:alcohol dehydrogenase
VHGKPAELRLQNLWIHNITISMGLVNTNTIPMLLKLVAQRKLNVGIFASHHFKLHDMLAAYDTFSRAAESKALKVIIDLVDNRNLPHIFVHRIGLSS